jgi:Saf4/Yju2 protein
LEKKVEDKRAFLTQQQRIEELAKASEKDWSDPYEMSKKLRREFRVGRRKRQADEKTGVALKERYGIEVDMLEEREEDAVKAKLIDFGRAEDVSASSKPLFHNGHSTSSEIDRGKRGKKLKPAEMATMSKSALQNQLKSNSRAALDPFLREQKVWQPNVKRKRPDEMPVNSHQVALVSYESDSS